MLSCTPKRAPHLPNTTMPGYQIIHPPPSGEHRNYLYVALGIQARPPTQLQVNELHPRTIHYADDTVLLFPQLPFLLCLLFFDALYVFLFVSVTSEVEMASHDETAMPDQPTR